MKIFLKLLIVIKVLLVSGCVSTQKSTLYLIGDSTVKSGEGLGENQHWGDMKSYTSRMNRKKMLEHKSDERIKRYLTSFMLSGLKSRKNIDWQFWEQHNHAVVIEDDEQFFNVLNYIHHNPVKAGICSSPEMYKYSSARNFSEENGLIE